MASDSVHPIPAELRQFIAEHVHSVEQLEILILLSENATKAWSVSEVFRQIQSSEKSVLHCLEEFRRAGLANLNAAGLYSFVLREGSLARIVPALAQAYRERRVSIIECIYKKPHDPIQNFADAFRLRKEK
jgi:hypothetical protein